MRTDIAPSLYALLGYEPADLGPLFGRSFFTPPNGDSSWRRREPFLLAWDLSAPGEPRRTRLEWHSAGITALAAAGDTLLTGYDDGVVKVWPIRNLLS